MQYSLALLLLLLVPDLGRATALAIVEYSGACVGTTENHGEVSAGVYIECLLSGGGGYAQAGTDTFPAVRPDYIFMHAYSNTLSGLAETRVTTSFDHLVLVTGTDQPGFLVLTGADFRYYDFSPVPYPTKWGRFSVMGQPIFPFTSQPVSNNDWSLPFIPGVPVRVFGEMTGGITPGDDTTWNGLFAISGGTGIFVSSTARTITPIEGASVTIVPEPSCVSLVLAAVTAFTMRRVRRYGH